MVVFIGLHENLMRFLNHKILNCLAIFSFSVFYSSRGALFLSFFPTLSLSLSLTFLLSHSPFLFFLFLSLFTHCHPLISHSFPFLSLFSIYSYPTFVLFSLSIHFLSLPYFLTLYLPLFSLSLSPLIFPLPFFSATFFYFPSSLIYTLFFLILFKPFFLFLSLYHFSLFIFFLPLSFQYQPLSLFPFNSLLYSGFLHSLPPLSLYLPPLSLSLFGFISFLSLCINLLDSVDLLCFAFNKQKRS